jgi:hypothetical protein
MHIDHRFTKRFASEKEAIAFAKKMSRDRKIYLAVRESPHPTDPENNRFIVDTDDFVRSWERLIAIFEKGKKQ